MDLWFNRKIYNWYLLEYFCIMLIEINRKQISIEPEIISIHWKIRHHIKISRLLVIDDDSYQFNFIITVRFLVGFTLHSQTCGSKVSGLQTISHWSGCAVIELVIEACSSSIKPSRITPSFIGDIWNSVFWFDSVSALIVRAWFGWRLIREWTEVLKYPNVVPPILW